MAQDEKWGRKENGLPVAECKNGHKAHGWGVEAEFQQNGKIICEVCGEEMH